MKNGVVIVAGGKGKRMEAGLPKQFLKIKEKPILMHTIERFYSFDGNMEIIVVLPENQEIYWAELCKKYDFKIFHKIAYGGETRFHSVKNGLQLIKNSQIIGIHDGVRPLVTNETLQNCYKTAAEKGSAIPVMPLVESIRKISDAKSISCNRAEYMAVQTPQVFKAEWLQNSYNVEYVDTFTDDASVVEAAGYSISLVGGNIENIKITSPIDIAIAEVLLNNFLSSSPTRTRT